MSKKKLWEQDDLHVVPEEFYRGSIAKEIPKSLEEQRELLSLLRRTRMIYAQGTFMYSRITETIREIAEKIVEIGNKAI